MYLILPPQINNAKLYLAVFAAVLGNFSFGYSMVYPSPVLPKLQAPDADPRVRLNTEQGAWFGSIYTLGAAAGGLGAMMLNDMIGRKVSILMSAVPSTIGWVRGSEKKHSASLALKSISVLSHGYFWRHNKKMCLVPHCTRSNNRVMLSLLSHNERGRLHKPFFFVGLDS